MDSDLGGLVQGIPERFVPETMRGQLLEAEHVGRYWWAASLVEDKRVLDAGCGTAYGSNILAEAGARDVVGVDIAESVIEAVRSSVRPAVRLEVADVGQLPFENDSFDVVVSFEVIEHLEEPETALREFARVLAERGVLAVSSPNRNVYVPGNPHHHHEFLPEELEDLLARHFANVRLFRQHDWLTSAVLPDETYTSTNRSPLRGMNIRKVVDGELGSELYTLALASDSRIPSPPASAVLTYATAVRAWLEHFDAQRAMLEEQAHRLTDLESLRRELLEVSRRLMDAETQLARVPTLEQERDEAVRDLDSQVETKDALLARHKQEVDKAHELLQEMQKTRVWRLGAAYWRFRDRLLGRR